MQKQLFREQRHQIRLLTGIKRSELDCYSNKKKKYTQEHKQSSLIRLVYLVGMEIQEKTFDILRQKGITWRLEQDLNGLIFMQKKKGK